MTETIVGPRKTRELHNHHFDSTIWNEFRFRDDDIIISTYAKSGTTWMQQIVAQMLLGGAFWDAGAQVFINKGVNGRWAETLTPEDVAEYEARAVQELPPECARWLSTGEEL